MASTAAPLQNKIMNAKIAEHVGIVIYRMFHMVNTKKIIKIKSSPVYDGNNWLPTKLLKSDDWREMDADALMKCDDCGHKSTE